MRLIRVQVCSLLLVYMVNWLTIVQGLSMPVVDEANKNKKEQNQRGSVTDSERDWRQRGKYAQRHLLRLLNLHQGDDKRWLVKREINSDTDNGSTFKADDYDDTFLDPENVDTTDKVFEEYEQEDIHVGKDGHVTGHARRRHHRPRPADHHRKHPSSADIDRTWEKVSRDDSEPKDMAERILENAGQVTPPESEDNDDTSEDEAGEDEDTMPSVSQRRKHPRRPSLYRGQHYHNLEDKPRSFDSLRDRMKAAAAVRNRPFTTWDIIATNVSEPDGSGETDRLGTGLETDEDEADVASDQMMSIDDATKARLAIRHLVRKLSSDAKDSIVWEEPRMEKNCWVQAMLSKVHNFSPSCNTDGTFSPKQCFLQRCWCVRPDGKPRHPDPERRFHFGIQALLLYCTRNYH